MTTRAMFPGMLLSDRYRLDDLLSQTGAARFWRGTDLVLGRSVAINALPSTDPLAPALIQAARDSATVHDPRLLRVLDADETGDITWVVNEWGTGVSLDILLQRGPLDPIRAAWLALETATTIQTAHAAGVCHGRLTPEAVLVTEAGAVKIIGFAVSASIEGGGIERASRTGWGHLEPAEADVIDLAGILYAALTAKWPGCSPSDVPAAPADHRGPLRPRQVRHGVPRMLDALCERVLRKGGHEHAQPIRSAVEIAAALNDFLGSPLTGAPIDIHGIYDDLGSQHSRLDPEATAVSQIVFEDTGRHFLSRSPGSLTSDITGYPTGEHSGDSRPADQHGHNSHPAARSPGHSGHPRGNDSESTQAARFVSTPADLEEPPELPPFEDSAERPLFAPTPRRPMLAAEPVEPAPQPPTGKHAAGGSSPNWGRRALFVALAIALVVAMLLAYRAGTHTSSAEQATPTEKPLTATQAASKRVRVVGISDFDPLGDPPEEHAEQAPLAIDADPATGWTTSEYRRADLGGLKEGVGLVLDLGTQVPVSSVQLELGGHGASVVQLRATPTGVNTPPHGLADLTGALAGATIAGRGQLAPASPVTTRFVVVWLTRLPQAAPGEFRTDIREISVRR